MMLDSRKAARIWTRQQTRHGRRAAWPVVALGLIATLAAIAQAACIAMVLSDRGLGLALGGFVVLAILRAGLQLQADRRAFGAGAAGRIRLRADIVARLLAAGPAGLRGRHSGELAAAAIDQVEALDGLFARWVPAAFLAVAGPAVVAGVAVIVDPVAAGILLVAGLLVPVGQAVAGIGAAAASRGQFIAMARLQARFLDRVRGIATIVLAGRTEDEARRLATTADELRRRTMRVLRVAFLSSAMLDCAMAAALVVIALRYRNLLTTPHEPAAATRALFLLLLVPEFFAPLRAFAAAYQDRLHATGAAESLAGIPPMPPAPAVTASRDVGARALAITFENVGVTFDASRGPALAGLSFFVPPGETLVLAGPSGAGKSTIIELLLGFVRPDTGRILISGHDITDILPAALGRLSAWIGQRPALFAGTLRENIAFARPEATTAEIEDAARQAHVTDFAEGLPSGLATPIGEGGYGISGGQAQRVAVARAFLKNAPLLLLDEPTAYLDPATEADILVSLRRLSIGRTVILASHSRSAHGLGGRRLDLRAGRQATIARGAA